MTFWLKNYIFVAHFFVPVSPAGLIAPGYIISLWQYAE
jgi:hypothetical protein